MDAVPEHYKELNTYMDSVCVVLVVVVVVFGMLVMTVR